MPPPIQYGDYQISVQMVFVNLWRATAINGQPVTADGFDAETALRKLAAKIGTNPRDLLREFGLT